MTPTVHWLRMFVLALINSTRRLVVAGFLAAFLGCSSDVLVEPANAISFEQTIMLDATIEGRAEAFNIAGYVRGDAPKKEVAYLEPMRLPEAFTLDGSEGVRSWQFHLGYAAARLIRAYYAASYPNGLRIESDKLVDIVDAAGGNTENIYEPNRDWPIEIADIEKRQVFEVVPPGETHRAYGKKKADFHLMFVNQTLFKRPQFGLGQGFSGEIGVRFGEKTPPWKLAFETVEPGVIAYQWSVLSVAKLTDEAHIEAYLQDRWHEPTPNEAARLGRSLHWVVEKLVQAREALGQIRARKEMPMVPGQTMADYVRALSLWSAHDSRIARLLPVMREPPAPAPRAAKPVRRDKRFIGETLITQVPNEGYTTDGKPGRKPEHFHLGSSAHKVIAMHYKLRQQEQDKVATNFISIKTIVGKAGGDDKLVLPHEALLRPDIANWADSKMEVFEIKPDKGNYLVEAQTVVTTYLAALNRGMVGKTPFRLGTGFEGNLGVMFAGGYERWNLVWRNPVPGVVLYKLRKLGVSAEDQAIAKAIKRAQDEGRWVDLTVKARIDEAYEDAYKNDRWVEMTDEEMAPYAKQLEEAVDMIVKDRELILEMQDLANVPIEVVGRIATDILTAELSRHLSPPKPKTKPPVKVSPGTLPPPAIPQNDNGVPLPAPVPAQSPRAPPAPVYKSKKAG